ncbi:GspMb/PilO family protein [uncultured Roseobacter sp.]|uniref:GspMb/PilO family protein n=1 Tax=uncultured Roseobacter sp. TaxID=114847 RepID=UPI002621B0BD|nr:GspMb/PilO family protein [uncultured Roseobacter sp.]
MSVALHKLLAWTLFVVLLGGLALIATTELLRLHQAERLRLQTLTLELAVAREAAQALPQRRAALAALQDNGPEAALHWPTPPRAGLLDLQEFAAATLREAGLQMTAIEPRMPDDDAPDLLRVGVRASGDLAAFQRALVALERHRQHITVARAQVVAERGADAGPPAPLEIGLDLRALSGSAEKAQR